VDTSKLKQPRFSLAELTGMTFLRELENGNSCRAKIVQKILDKDAQNPQQTKFLVKVGDNNYDEIISYNELSKIIEEQQEKQSETLDTTIWSFKGITSHKGPLLPTHPEYKGSSYNVLVEWDDGSESWEPLDTMIKDDPVSVALYASDNNLLDTPGCKRIKHVARSKKRMNRMINQTKVNRKGANYSFGVQVPRNAKQAIKIDAANGNTRWTEAMDKEIANIQAYNTFKDMGVVTYMAGYKKIIVHFVFAVKHDLRHKARLVAGGHLTEPKIEGSY
jgi:hypothetical protein